MSANIASTTSSVYSLLKILLQHSQVMHRLQQDFDFITNSSRHPNLSDRENMPYTMTVINELLRYTSVAPMTPR